MKYIFKIFLLSTVLLGAFTSCEDSDNAIDILYDNVNDNTAFIRTLEEPSTAPHSISGANNFPTTIEASIEIQQGDGSFTPDFKEVRIYTNLFQDNSQEVPVLDDQDVEIAEALLYTLLPEEFVPSELNNLPSTNFAVPTQLIVDNNPTAQFTTPTYIYLRLELELSDGTIYTDNVSPTVASGDYFIAPMAYNIIFLNI